MNSIICTAPEYSLKYDEKTNDLNDRTYQDLCKNYGKNSKIKCPCMNREYLITSSWTKTHFDSLKHRNWKTNQQNEYIKEFGHCVSSEQIIEKQNKEIKNYKKLTYNYNETIKTINKLNEDIKNENEDIKRELKKINEENIEMVNEIKKYKENEIQFSKDILSYEKDIITLSKEKDLLNFKLNKNTIKFKTQKNPKPFRT
tara:strand:+ start:1487 stop:2086 length:600 start_codon:yes stop_codon:yes gene_type:complete